MFIWSVHLKTNEHFQQTSEPQKQFHFGPSIHLWESDLRLSELCWGVTDLVVRAERMMWLWCHLNSPSGTNWFLSGSRQSHSQRNCSTPHHFFMLYRILLCGISHAVILFWRDGSISLIYSQFCLVRKNVDQGGLESIQLLMGF